jgi:hypothetical protein
MLVASLLVYMTVLHVVYLSQGGRYSVPLMPFMAVFCAHMICAAVARARALRGASRPGLAG